MIFKLITNNWFKREVYEESQELYENGSVIQQILDRSFRYQDFYTMCSCYGLKFKKVIRGDIIFLKGIKNNQTIIKAINF